jgi:hypothetical protein
VVGKVLLRDGSPAANVRVAAASVPQGGAADAATIVLARLVQTDGDGNYRLENVPPGRYYIIAGRVDYPTYYPGVLDLSAAVAIDVTSQVAITGINFTVGGNREDFPGVRVSGRVTRSTNDGLRLSSVLLVPLQDPFVRNPPSSPIGLNGNFEFYGVPPGTYRVSVQVVSGTMRTVTIDVGDKDISGVEVAIPKVLEIKGRVLVQGSGKAPGFSFRMEPAAFGRMTFEPEMKTDGTFSVRLPEGVHFTVSGFGSSYALKSLTYAGIDVLKDPVAAGDGDMIVTFETSR